MLRRTLPSPSSIRLVTINDVYELTNLPRLSTYLQSLRDSSMSPSADAVLLAGDFVSPSTLSAVDSGRGIVRTLRAAGVTHVSLGNHEADVKLGVLNERIKELGKSAVVVNTNSE